MATTLASQVQELYIGYLGRAADKAGLDFWVKAIENGTSTLESVALGFTLSAEYKAAYEGLTTTQLVAKVYQNVLGRVADADGLGFWVGEINKGVVKADTLVKSMINSLGAIDQLNMDNKVQAANTYTTTAGDKYDLAAAKAAIGASTSNNPGQTFTLTNSTDNIVGTSGNDTIVGDNVSTSAGDQINGGAGTDTLKLYGNAVKPAFSNVEKVYLNGNTAGFDVSTNSEVTNLDLDDVATNQTYTIANGQAVSVSNIAATEIVDFAGNTVTALNLALNNVAATGNDATIDLNSTAQTSVSITTSGTKSQVTLLNTGAKLDTINIAAGVALELGHALTTVKTINAAASTAGVDIDAVGASDLTFTGGAGNDRIALGATLTAADTIKGGAGTDTLSISDADTIDSAAEVANVSEFEIFEAAAADTATYDLSFLNAKNSLTGLIIAGAGATTTVSNINAASVGNISITADATAVLTAKDFVSGGTSDTATITLQAAAGITDGADAILTFANLDVLNLVSKSDGTPTKTVGGAEENSLNLTATDLEKIVITGDEAVVVTTAAGTLPTEIDASGMTDAAVSIDTDASAIVSLLVKGTAQNDTIDIDNAATLTSTLYLGGGNDTVIVTGGGTGAHTLKFTAEALNSGDVKAGNVSIVTLSGANAGDTITLDFTSAFEGLLKSGGTVLSAATGNVNIHGTALSSTTNIAATQTLGNMVVQIDLNGDGAYNAADDYQITLVGTLANDTLVYNAATDVFTFTVV